MISSIHLLKKGRNTKESSTPPFPSYLPPNSHQFIILYPNSQIGYSLTLMISTALVNVFGGGLVAKSCPTLATPWAVACQAPWDSPGKNTGVGYHFLLQGIFPTQELNPGLLCCRQILY